MLLYLGGGFVGIGLIWLVAANLDQLSPVARFVAVALLWLAFLVGGELLASRKASAPVVGAARLLAALGIGAVLFQAAQSLQVPAFEPRLLGLWSAGALLHGYVVPGLHAVPRRRRRPASSWWFTQPLWDEPSGLTVVMLFGAGAVLAAGLAVLHDGRLDAFAWTWRTVAGGMALLGALRRRDPRHRRGRHRLVPLAGRSPSSSPASPRPPPSRPGPAPAPSSRSARSSSSSSPP